MIEALRELVQGKRVLILGYGREGRATWNLLKRAGGYERIAIADRNTNTMEPGVEMLVGEDYLAQMEDFDLVFKSPGIVLPRPLSEYRCAFVSETEVFFRYYRDRIVGITGTKGKSTTTSLLYHILKEAGKDCIIAGNIGIPAFDMVDRIGPETAIVFEMSCHQLEFLTVSPRIAVLLNIHEEHLDHYGTMEKYVAAKQNIFRHQKAGDLFFCGEQCLPQEPVAAHLVKVGDGTDTADVELQNKTIVYGSRRYVIDPDRTPLLGHHNYYDIAFVYAICQEFGISDEAFTAALSTYQTLPHRLQFLGTKNGVKYYDDSISTIGDTTIQALKTLPDTDTVLIGGMDRGIDYGDLIGYLSDSEVPHIILMEQTGKRIYQEIMRYWPDFKGRERLILVDHLKTAVRRAAEVTREGHSCVLSPASASYGIFKNFEERGEVFARYVFETEPRKI
ncbi:MAG: UDP-N-acetylmuramoyl-L-alanine--D-glutamate ligase [Eubacteriales bacterium]|nr:UDP-N-acetylmuramoyl-L-alanine--D-glutamate ligase [Eubacteriales bacterium]